MNTLRQKIGQEIRDLGPIPFSRYMELCLYDPELGYYSRNAEQFGKAGDFYTSIDVHAVFGRLMARQFEEMWRALGSPNRVALVELGPGRGLFAQDVLDWSERNFPDFFRALHYVLVESSPALRQRIEATLAHHIKAGRVQLSILDLHSARPEGLRPTEGFQESGGFWVAQRFSSAHSPQPSPWALFSEIPAIVFANEFFDALAVEVLSPQGALRIDARDLRFVETWSPPAPRELEFLDRYSVQPESGERVEVPLIAQRSIEWIAASLDRGFIIAIDYGYTRDEQLAGRHRGTVKSFRRHSVSASPYEAPGEQDITADVNFTALAAAAEERGMLTQKLRTQSQFLMGIGEANQFADAFKECRLPQERAKVALQLKHLVTPAGMGESFHVLMASKGVEPEKVAALAGLSFGASKIRG